jgi:hypothetical protein
MVLAEEESKAEPQQPKAESQTAQTLSIETGKLPWFMKSIDQEVELADDPVIEDDISSR